MSSREDRKTLTILSTKCYNTIINQNIMTKKTWSKIDKKGHEEEWSIDETPEVLAAIKALAQLKRQDDGLNYDTSGK